ncbi:hypothetical protein BDM02DRAFT_3112162 [Thelephora ganbajun]|uniref:Uncharacterized protein n=1 Tax=Thelephora ganbajun TaxID=370292 RepID=A0ACB6ZL45_THEGA|nr:hypothetical protein BDM02DRAFT_3112162 [Thelephora ganbajun]
MPPTAYYKVRALLDVFCDLVIPCVATTLVLHYSGRWRLGFPSIPPYIASIMIYFAVRVKYADFLDEREAQKLNARLLSRVVGKLPSNVDVIPLNAGPAGSLFARWIFLTSSTSTRLQL